ncbi:glycosyltransferase [bacterium]|nr:glycosyltransferase [bacterium]MBU1615875.1 glycosyltransferase [bacterium]
MERDLPLVSIVTPSFNQTEFIEETILSVKSQDYPNIEHIVIDGGSTDGTLDILKKYSHLTWISEPDKGQSDAINKGFQMAKGEVIGWLNSDDTYMPYTVKTCVEFLLKHSDIAMIHGDFNEINEVSQIMEVISPGDVNLTELIQGSCIGQPTIFFRNNILKEVGLLNLDLEYVMDYDLCVRIAEKFKIKHIPVILANFRWHSKSKSGAKSDMQEYEHRLISDKYCALHNITPQRFLDGVKDSMGHYKKIKQRIRFTLYRKQIEDDFKNVLFYGVSEVAEITLRAAEEIGLEVIAMADKSIFKQGKIVLGKRVIPPHQIKELKPDGIIITSFSHQEEIHNDIKYLEQEGIKVIKLF